MTRVTPGGKSTKKAAKPQHLAEVRKGPSANDAHDIVYYLAEGGTRPAADFLDSIPPRVAARIRAAVIAVATAPPSKFAGGGLWEAMHGDMTGWFEIRVDGPPSRTHYRVFCLIDVLAENAEKPYLVLVDGRSKAFRTEFAESVYEEVRAMGTRYRATQPRPIA